MTHGSLFSGIGGFELGAEMSDIKTIWNCEIEEQQRKVLKKHFPNTKQYTDITKMNNPKYVDIISGGFPCQDLSIANVSNKEIWNNGKVAGIKGKRSGLWSEMWRIIREVRPKYVIVENSPMLLVRGFERVINDLSQIGYCIEWQTFLASQFGFNHKRKRFFGIAYSEQMRCVHNTSIFRELREILQEQTPRQNNLPMPTKRINSKTNFALLRMDDGFSKELDRSRIEMLGNAVVPDIAHYLFECVKKHNQKIL